ncbi:hypothetical protein GCM10017655_14680 [Pseudomonas turukhanskensis]|uniref:Uncharacterized protein n=1 Tax=Pseudomonas turukhanskensis TaxID=1806536 RepID=A0A9W6NF92_9PSED|nr:hypothetical protein GCM10017655_14680 [Pseudomonas turukhanskensis]
MQTLTSAGKAGGFGDGDKGIEVGQIHTGIPLGYPKYEKYEFELFKASPYDSPHKRKGYSGQAEGAEEQGLKHRNTDEE